jgi:hypothetical protein
VARVVRAVEAKNTKLGHSASDLVLLVRCGHLPYVEELDGPRARSELPSRGIQFKERGSSTISRILLRPFRYVFGREQAPEGARICDHHCDHLASPTGLSCPFQAKKENAPKSLRAFLLRYLANVLVRGSFGFQDRRLQPLGHPPARLPSRTEAEEGLRAMPQTATSPSSSHLPPPGLPACRCVAAPA